MVLKISRKFLLINTGIKNFLSCVWLLVDLGLGLKSWILPTTLACRKPPPHPQTHKKKKKKPSSTISTNTIATTTKNLNPTSLAEMPWPPLLPSSGYPSPSLKSESEASTSSQQNLDTQIGHGAQSLPHHVHALPFLQWGKSQAKSSTSYLAHEFHKPIFVRSFFSLHDTLGVLSPLTSSSHLVF